MIKTLFRLLQTLKRGLRLTNFVVLASLFLILITENHGRHASQTRQSPPLNIATINHLDPTDFTEEELRYLQKRFGVHGPQTHLSQLFTRGIDHLQPLRAQTVNRLDGLKPVIMRESKRYRCFHLLLALVGPPTASGQTLEYTDVTNLKYSLAKYSLQKIPSERSQAKDPKRKIPSERAQAKDKIQHVIWPI